VSANDSPTGQNGGMNRPSGGNGEFARGASAAAAKGALLIGLAVIVGVFLLQKVDTSTAGPSASARVPVSSPKTTTTVHRTQTASSTTSTTQPSTPVKTPSQLKVLVLNGGAATGAAARLRTSLQQVGYTNQPQASTWSGHTQTGKSILCRSGLAREAVALAQQTALQGAKVAPFPTPAPPSSDGVDCVIVVGA
jgi:LytR cell envelope-related transcriptional attenuator